MSMEQLLNDLHLRVDQLFSSVGNQGADVSNLKRKMEAVDTLVEERDSVQANLAQLSDRIRKLDEQLGRQPDAPDEPADHTDEKQRRIHWQGIAYAAMNLIDFINGNVSISGGCCTEDTVNEHLEKARKYVKELRKETTRLEADNRQLEETKDNLRNDLETVARWALDPENVALQDPGKYPQVIHCPQVWVGSTFCNTLEKYLPKSGDIEASIDDDDNPLKGWTKEEVQELIKQFKGYDVANALDMLYALRKMAPPT